jgi:hypothetical protein
MGMSHTDERFHEHVQRLVQELDPVPPPPREELWARIDAARRYERTPSAGATSSLPLPARRSFARRAALWSLPLAATLALGVALGRLTLLREQTPGASPAGSPAPGAVAAGAPAAGSGEVGSGGIGTAAAAREADLAPYRQVASEHLARTEALLTALPTDTRAGQGGEVVAWAGDLLTDTRLLMDSPVRQDPELLRLLEDLELVLAQIAALPAERPESDVALIQDGMDRRYLLLRLRAATARSNRAAS